MIEADTDDSSSIIDTNDLVKNTIPMPMNENRENASPLSTPSTFSPSSTKTTSKPASSSQSQASQWHKERRRQMMSKYGTLLSPLERQSSSQNLALPLLVLSNLSLALLSIACGRFLSAPQIVALAVFPGSMLSLWQLQILHDCLHGSLLRKASPSDSSNSSSNSSSATIEEKKKKSWYALNRNSVSKQILFWGSMPSMFGYYLYLNYGHLTHHKNLGDAEKASLAKLFSSNQTNFEDGDVLFVAHRMKLKGGVGPVMFGGKQMSVSKFGFNLWRDTKFVRNAITFASSFMLERVMLIMNDFVVAVFGRNFFFPNKPLRFHRECALYCRCAVLVRLALFKLGGCGYKSWLFLWLSETLWSVPPHPACAMFVTNHGSSSSGKGENDCVPSSSTYAGKWYSVFTLGTNYHVEHHDFPNIPLNKLGLLRNIAPEYYRQGNSDNVFRIMKNAFSKPDYYACMDAGVGGIVSAGGGGGGGGVAAAAVGTSNHD
eukprot:CAMPEP_0195510460 /NCGR_PEP_ID=MMETSP0794_2-20130614/3099_1 /TAXON_ID=515487 /ORGANISM="Stephanopyxis turris, Strain CCMP 815" /LENGTH=487 /DNA_ID=CAMNT_0040637887 /DNA_START=290 /DNA_END=1753 /DNA_ORIENTATION=+